MSEAAIVQEEHTGAPESERALPTQYLTFKIAGENYAIGVLQVKEILRFETITQVPSTPPSIRGVINLRGSVVPVVDLAVKFGLPESQITKWSCIVIVEADLDGEQTVMGVMADAVSQVVEFLPGDIQPPPPFGTNVSTDYLVGMGNDEKKFVLILDINKVLTAEELMTASHLATDEEGRVEEGEPTPEVRDPAEEPPPTAAGEAGEASEEGRQSQADPTPSPEKARAAIEVEAQEPSDGKATEEGGDEKADGKTPR
jgi:purine-binding chemotaxis protein CheW